MANETSIDWSFISSKEGGTKTVGYVPVCSAKSLINPSNRTCFGKPAGSVIGKSGVTIGAGVDLGQMNLKDLQSLHLPPHLFFVLKEFVGKKKQEALKALDEYEKKNNRKVQITFTDAQIVNQRVKEKTLRQLTSNYDKHATTKFSDLPVGVQTALASIAFQYGPNMHASKNQFVQKIWKGYVDRDYAVLVDTLGKAPEYVSRRKEEATLINNGSIGRTLP